MEKPRILIVEDEAIIAMGIENQLQSLGYEVTSIVDTGEKAIKKAIEDKPDLILMDIRIKGEMDGIDTAEVIRNKFGIPVIFSTAYLDQKRIERAKITMPFGYVLKPIQDRDLKITLEMALYVAKVDRERKQAKEALKESELLFSQIFEQSTTSTCLYNPEGTIIRANSEFRKMFGVKEEVITGGKYNVFEDQAAKYAGIIPLLKEIFEKKKTSKWEFNFNLDVSSKSTGTATSREGEVYLEVFGYPIVDGEDKLKYVVLQHYDISKRKQTEDSLRKLSNAVEQSPASVIITDLSGAIEYVNPKFEQLTGYSLEEAKGKNPSILKSGEQFDSIYEELWNTITAGREWHGTFHNKKKNGELYWESATISPIKDDEGKITSYLAVKEDITERKLAEDSILKERDFAAAILRSIDSIVVVIDLDGYIITFNKAAERCSGYTLEEVRQKPFWEVLVPSEDRNSVKNVILDVKTKALPIEYENRWVTKDGQERLIHWFNSVLKATDGNLEYILCTGLDLTERSQIEEALHRSEDHYQTVLENMQEGYFQIDLAGNITTVNKSLADTLGYSTAELIGMNYRTYMDKENANIVMKIYNDVYLSGKPQKYLTYEIIHKSGEIRAVEVSTSLLYHSDGKPIGFFGISRDVTGRKRMEEMMIQTEKMMSVGGLAAGMAHELNNPLGGMLQGVQNIQRRLSPGLESNLKSASESGIDLYSLQLYMEKRGIHSYINGVQESGKKASQIISSMLQFSRKSESKMAPIDLAVLLENSLELAAKDYNLKTKYDFRKIRIIKEFDSNLPLVPCTETEIEQVFLNLLNNAAWAMANEKSDTSPQIILRLNVENQMVRIVLEDNGPGMNEAVRKRIFEPFFTTKPVGEGTGLGLSISYKIIANNHKGTMEVDSCLGKGTRFTFKLPLERKMTA